MAKKKNSTPIETKIEQTIDIATSEESVDIDVSFDDSDETIDLAFDNAMDEIDEQKDLKDKALKEKPRIAKHKNMKKAKAKAFKRDG